jgi:hypothetical protein
MEPESAFVRPLTQRSVSQFTFSSSDVWRGVDHPRRAVLLRRLVSISLILLRLRPGIPGLRLSS